MKFFCDNLSSKMAVITGSTLKIQQLSFFWQYVAAAACMLNIITSGMHYGWPSPSLPILESNTSTFQITSDQGSWMAVMVLIGSVIGSLMVGVTVDIIGRKRTIIIASFPYFASWIMIAFANSVTVMYLARFMAGVADGWVFTATPMYISEISHPSIRGILGSGISSLWVGGTVLVNIMGSYLSISTTALISSLLPVMCLLSVIKMPESPYYYILKNNKTEARRSLQKFRGSQDVEEEFTNISLAVKEQTENTGKFLDLFKNKTNRKAVAIMCILRGAQQMSGTSAITFYLQKIFIEAGDDISSELASTIYLGIQLIMCCCCSGVVDKTGRRPLLLISILGSALALSVEGSYFMAKDVFEIDSTYFNIIPVVALICFVVIFSLGMQTIPILIIGEIFPSNVKGFALCVADIYFSLVASIVSKFFQIMNDNFGMYMPFYAFAIACLVGFVCIYLYVPETKGKTLEQIQEELKSGCQQNTK